jgi:hypothetical protein
MLLAAATAWSSSDTPPSPTPLVPSTERTKQAPVCICEQYLSTVGICYVWREGVGRKKLVLEADWPTSTIPCYPVHSLQSLAHTAAHPPAWQQPTGEHRCFPAKFRGRGTELWATGRGARSNSGIWRTSKMTWTLQCALQIRLRLDLLCLVYYRLKRLVKTNTCPSDLKRFLRHSSDHYVHITLLHHNRTLALISDDVSKGRDHWEDLRVDGRIILEWILGK